MVVFNPLTSIHLLFLFHRKSSKGKYALTPLQIMFCHKEFRSMYPSVILLYFFYGSNPSPLLTYLLLGGFSSLSISFCVNVFFLPLHWVRLSKLLPPSNYSKSYVPHLKIFELFRSFLSERIPEDPFDQAVYGTEVALIRLKSEDRRSWESFLYTEQNSMTRIPLTKSVGIVRSWLWVFRVPSVFYFSVQKRVKHLNRVKSYVLCPRFPFRPRDTPSLNVRCSDLTRYR